MRMNIVSVVIPIYNAEKYLVRCIESVLNQSYQNLEIILINDGSTDASLTICENYCFTDNRIVLRSINNQGAGQARKIGVEIATGDYLCFLERI